MIQSKHARGSTRSAAMILANTERRNAMLADTVGRQAKMIERLRSALRDAYETMNDGQADLSSGVRRTETWKHLGEGADRAAKVWRETAAQPTGLQSDA